jgi:hypothetical protein
MQLNIFNGSSMSILSSFCKPIFLFSAIFAVVIAYILYKKNPLFLIVFVIISLCTVLLFKFSSIKTTLLGINRHQNIAAFFYDTDATNNEYIKGDLNEWQLRKLDRILSEEKRLCGLRLSDLRLNELSSNNNQVTDAYDRWRKCKDMYRSYHKIVYPDERERVLQERR